MLKWIFVYLIAVSTTSFIFADNSNEYNSIFKRLFKSNPKIVFTKIEGVLTIDNVFEKNIELLVSSRSNNFKINSVQLLQSLKKKIDAKTFDEIKAIVSTSLYIKPNILSKFGITFLLNRQSKIINMTIPYTFKKSSDISLTTYNSGPIGSKKITKSSFSGYINSTFNQSYNKTQSQKNGFTPLLGSFNSFSKLFDLGLVTESRFDESGFQFNSVYTFYESYSNNIVVNLGDLSNKTIGSQTPFQMKMLSINSLNLRLNSDRTPLLDHKLPIELEFSAALKIFINDVQKTFIRLPAGFFTLTNLPLDQGNNQIRIEITYDDGTKSEINETLFQEYSNILSNSYGFFAGTPDDSSLDIPYILGGNLSFKTTSLSKLILYSQYSPEQALVGSQFESINSVGIYKLNSDLSKLNNSVGLNISAMFYPRDKTFLSTFMRNIKASLSSKDYSTFGESSLNETTALSLEAVSSIYFYPYITNNLSFEYYRSDNIDKFTIESSLYTHILSTFLPFSPSVIVSTSYDNSLSYNAKLIVKPSFFN
ncbi:hypothetical protein HOG98_07830, partial [bacterium]|nr:hypothetical protein [bacterium]